MDNFDCIGFSSPRCKKYDCLVEITYNPDEGYVEYMHGRPEIVLRIPYSEYQNASFNQIREKYLKWVEKVHDYWDECEEKTLNYEEHYRNFRM